MVVHRFMDNCRWSINTITAQEEDEYSKKKNMIYRHMYILFLKVLYLIYLLFNGEIILDFGCA